MQAVGFHTEGACCPVACSTQSTILCQPLAAAPPSLPSSAPSFLPREAGASGEWWRRGAMLHVIGDLVQSVGVAIAGALIWWKQVCAPLGHLAVGTQLRGRVAMHWPLQPLCCL